MSDQKFLILKITKTARIATDYGDELDLDACLAIVGDLNRDALEDGSDDRWVPDRV